MAAIVAGRVALGLGGAPKVSPRCTGAVDGFTWLFCAGMAAVSAALGCGARFTICGFTGTTGRLTFASICTGFGSGFGLGNSICLGRNSNCSLGCSISGGSLGSGGRLIFISGGALELRPKQIELPKPKPEPKPVQ